MCPVWPNLYWLSTESWESWEIEQTVWETHGIFISCILENSIWLLPNTLSEVFVAESIRISAIIQYAYKRYAYKKSVLFHLLGLMLVFDSILFCLFVNNLILFCLFVNNLILFCLFVDAGQKEGLRGFEYKHSLCSVAEKTLRLNVDILR